MEVDLGDAVMWTHQISLCATASFNHKLQTKCGLWSPQVMRKSVFTQLSVFAPGGGGLGISDNVVFAEGGKHVPLAKSRRREVC